MDVSKQEGRDIDSAAAAVIARAADGSFRDAFGLLDKCLRAADGEVTAALAEEITGLPPHELISQIVFAGLAKRNPKPALQALERARDSNLDPGQLFDRVIAIVRAVLLVRLAPDLAAEIKGEVSTDLFAKIEKEANKDDSSISAKTLHTLLSHHNELTSDTLGNLPLELVVMKLTDR
jgi:DNA polymerase-3 subunit gamma/tau